MCAPCALAAHLPAADASAASPQGLHIIPIANKRARNPVESVEPVGPPAKRPLPPDRPHKGTAKAGASGKQRKPEAKLGGTSAARAPPPPQMPAAPTAPADSSLAPAAAAETAERPRGTFSVKVTRPLAPLARIRHRRGPLVDPPRCKLTAPPPPARLQPGSKLLALDVREMWCKATIIRTRGEGETLECYLHYHGWKARWDEWVPLRSGRLRPLLE